jgi:hypothetical protein
LRAATVIIAAIAASSILIALSLIVTGGGDSKGSTVTRTVTEEVVAAAPKKKPGETTGQETSTPQVGGPTPCAGSEVTVEDVSCEIGTQVHAQYEEGGRGELLAEDTSETITMTCDEATSPITCTGPGGAVVYFGK